MQKITPFIWFNHQAEEAAKLYTTVFKNSKILSTMKGPGDTVMSVTVELEGLQYILFNGGPQFKLTEAMSLFVNCHTQEEIDRYWEKLSEGGMKSRCGWLKDKFGLWWQIVPPILGEYLQDKDTAKTNRVMQAMLQMDKLDIKKLQQAYDNE